jgi:shikimate kinase
MKNIILIGYRCTGKTSVGEKLARRLELPFIDTDELIVREAGVSVNEIVRRGGWPLFRQKEQEVIEYLASTENSIIALGGGALEHPENRNILKKNGLFVWLTADVKTIVERMYSDQKSRGQQRPPLSDDDLEAETTAMVQKREPVYRRLADLTIDVSKKGLDAVADSICDFLEKERTCRETPSEHCSG